MIIAKDETLFSTNTQTENHGAWLPGSLEVPMILYNPSFSLANHSLEVKTTQLASTMPSTLGLPLAQLNGWKSKGSVLHFLEPSEPIVWWCSLRL